MYTIPAPSLLVKWAAMSSSRRSSQSRDQIQVSCILIIWATREVPDLSYLTSMALFCVFQFQIAESNNIVWEDAAGASHLSTSVHCS